MKKLLLFMTFCLASLGMFAGSGADWKNAIDFDWSNGNIQTASGSALWYKIDLNSVAADENVLVYVTNMTSSDAHITARAYVVNGESIVALGDAETKTLAPNKKDALEIPAGIIKALTTKVVYVELTSDKEVKGEAEPVEPGEKDLDCMDATVVTIGTPVNVAAGQSWYKLDMSSVIADPTKTVKLTVTNTSAATATVTAGVSFDCPSSGVTEVKRTIAAGASDGGTLERSYLNMLADGTIYIKVTSNKSLKVLVEVVDAPVEPTLDVDGTPTVLAVNTEYNYTAGTTVWYQINKADIDVRTQLPEISVTNLGSATAHADGNVVFQLTGGVPISRSETLAAGATRTEEIKRNLIESIAEDVIYIQAHADQDMSFIIRMKSQFEGDGCKHSKDFIWNVYNNQNAGDTVWYAVNIADAKAATPAKDIKISVKNVGSAHTDVFGDVAFECPYTSLTSDKLGLNPGEEKEIVLGNAIFTSLAADEIYIRATADQPVQAKAELVDAELINITECASAVDFDLTTGALTTADTTWFKVDLAAVRANDKVPTITVKNNATSTQNVSVEAAFECPVTTAMQKKTETMAPGQEISFTVDKDQLNAIDATITEAYLRVAGNNVSIAIDWNYEDAGATCDKAIEFNWLLGNEQEADESLWYVIDITDAKACGEAVKVTIVNEGTATADVTGALAFECPVSAPTTASFTLAPGESKSKVISSSVLGSLVNPVYIRLTGNQKLKVTAESCVAEAPATNPGCDSAIDFDWVNGHIQLAASNAEQWYRLALDTLRGGLVPELTLENISGTDITIVGELTYDCTKATTGKTITMTAGQTITKTLEKSLIDGILTTYDYAYIKVTTTGDISFQSALVNNEDGRDCEHAKDFDFVNGNAQNAGDTIWYVVDLAEAKAQNKSINLGISNLDGFSGKVWAKLFFTCDDATPFAEGSETLSANADKGPYNLAAGLIQSLTVDKVLVQLYTAQADSVWATYGAAETSPAIDICDHSSHIKMQWNIDFPHYAGAEQWYFVDVKDIQDNTTGDAVLTITNNGSTDAHLTAELAYYCSGDDKRESNSITVAAGDTYTRTATRALINNIGEEKAFLGITSDADVTFRIELRDARGADCANPIEFDWLHGTYHAADSVLWYEIDLDTIKNSADKNDLRVHVINVGTGSTNTKAEVKTDCADDFLGDATATLAVNDTMKKDLGYTLLESFGWPSVFVKLTANENVKVVAELIPQAPKEVYNDTIIETVCDGTIYYTMDSLEQHVINAYTTWNDTIEFRDSVNFHMADSVITYQIHPIKMPTLIAKADLTKAPYVVCGEAISVEDITAELTSKFAAAKGAAATPDTVADVTAIEWKMEDPVTHVYDTIPEGKLAFAVEAVNLKYVVTTACDETAESEVFNVIADRKHEGEVSIVDTLCYGNNVYTNQQGVDVVLSGNTVWADTIVTAKSATVDTATIFNYDVKFHTPVALPTTLNTMPTAQAGAALDLTTAENDLISQIEGTYEALTEPVTGIYFEQLFGDAFGTPSTERIAKDVNEITLRYVVEGECNWYYDTITVTVNPYVVVDYAAPLDTLCPGDTYADLYGNVYTINANKTWTDTVQFDYTADQYADSVITYNVYVYTQPAVPAYTTAITAQAGKAIDVTAQTTELQNAADAADTDIMSDVTGIYWFVMEGGSYVALDPAALLPTETTQVQLIYSITTACGDSLSASPIVVDVEAPVELHLAVVDTVCLGTEYASRLATTTISTLTSWSERVTNITVDANQLGDSIYDYTIAVYSIPTVPAAATSLPIAICGQPVVVTDAQAEIDDAMAAAKTDLDSEIESAVWMINYGQGYEAFDATANVDATIENITMKYVVTFACGDVVESPEMPIVVEYPTAENTADFNDMPAVSKYGNRLLMIDLNAIEASLGYKLTEDMVKWYKVVGTKDVLDAEGNVDDDEFVGEGFYYTITETGEALAGDFYALIVTAAGNDDPCGSTMRTTVLSCAVAASVSIAPTVAAPGETITLSNLNPDLVYIINVFDVSGMKVDSFQIANAQSYNFQAATTAGYYMLSIEGEADMTLKYIVK